MSWSHREYYRTNRDKLLRARRRRYRNDPAYRRRAIAQAQRRYKEVVRGTRASVNRRVIVNAKGQEFYSIGMLADAIGRGVQTIREYERRGIVPMPLHFDVRGWRLYTAGQADLMRNVFLAVDKGDLKKSEVAAILRKNWRKKNGDGQTRSNGQEDG